MENAPWNFDFGLLADPAFKEDSVREELIAPLLRKLGYSASPPNQIIRSKTLNHPYVYFGTKSYHVKIIPDYLLTKNGVNFLIVDAKAPDEEIHTGKNVEQAYSYAIHRDIRAQYFALCNGKEFALFHIGGISEVFTFPLEKLAENWSILVRLIGTEGEIKKAVFKPDFGLHCLRLGFILDGNNRKIIHYFTSLEIFTAALVDVDTFSLQSYLVMDGVTFLATFDFNRNLFDLFFELLQPRNTADQIKEALVHQPFKWHHPSVTEPIPFIGLQSEIGDVMHVNDDESYIPFIVKNFL